MPKSKWGLKRQNEELLAEVKRLKQDNQCFEIRQSMQKLHEALKPRYVRLDELVNNTGLKHVALLIFKKLSPEDLGNCRLVSKGWKECIDNDKHWWQQVQFAHCKRVITTYRSVLDGKETLYEYCPELMDVIEYVYQNESIENMKLFSEFMIDYEDDLTESMDRDVEPGRLPAVLGPLYYALEQERLDILKLFIRSPMKNLNVADFYTIFTRELLRSMAGYSIGSRHTLMYMRIQYYNNHCCLSIGQCDSLEMVSYGSFPFDQTRYNECLSLMRPYQLDFEAPDALAEENKKKVFVCVNWSGRDCTMYLLIASEIYYLYMIFYTKI